MTAYGSALLVRRADGSPHVESSDPVIGISLELYREIQEDGMLRFDPVDGSFVLAGQARYRQSGLDGEVVICRFLGWVDGR